MQRVLLLLLFLGAFFPSPSRGDSAAPQRDLAWRKIAEDLEYAELEISPALLFPTRLTLVRTGLRRYRIGVIRAAEFGWKNAHIKALAEASRALVAINANFFDELGRPLGLVVSRGIQHHPLHRGGRTLTGVFQVSREGMAILNREAFRPKSVLEAVQAGPLLITNRAPLRGLQENKTSSRRSGLCVDSEGRLVVFCISPGLGEASLDDLQAVLVEPGIRCREALNLDGGGSSQLFIAKNLPGAAHESQEILLPGRDEIPIALGLFPID